MVAPRGWCRPRGGPRFPGPGSGQGHPPYRYGAGGRTIGVMNDHEDRPGADPASPPAGAGPTPAPPPTGSPSAGAAPAAGAGASRIHPDPRDVPGGHPEPGPPVAPDGPAASRDPAAGPRVAPGGSAASRDPADEPTVVGAGADEPTVLGARAVAGEVQAPSAPPVAGEVRPPGGSGAGSVGGAPEGSDDAADRPTTVSGGGAEEPTSTF